MRVHQIKQIKHEIGNSDQLYGNNFECASAQHVVDFVSSIIVSLSPRLSRWTGV